MAANKNRIVLGGKVFELLRVRGSSPEAASMLATEEERWLRPSAEDLQTMIEWFRFESGAGTEYVKAFIRNKKADVFFLIEKGKPIGFFSILKERDRAYLSSLYIKKELRRGFGKLLVARALRIARKSGFRELVIPEMTDSMHVAAAKAIRESSKPIVKHHEVQYEEGDAGPDMLIQFRKILSRRQRALKRSLRKRLALRHQRI